MSALDTHAPESAPSPPDAAAAGHRFSVECQGVRKAFPDSTSAALDGVDLEIPGGKITVLLGPSGCGKTTLLRSICGLEEPDSGHIRIGDHDVTHVPAQDRGVAMVFQDYALYPQKTVRHNIEFPLKMARVPRRERAERVSAIAETLRLGALLGRRPAQLSGGQRQRVGIGRALVRHPDVLLMDEPFSNLDAELRVRMRGELLTIHQQVGTTIVFVTHDQVEALSLADQLVVMNQGSVEQSGPPGDVFDVPATAFVAGFLCDMNLLPLQGHPHHAGPADAATVGFRPEDLHLGPGDTSDLQFDAQVTLSELHGRERVLHLRVEAETAGGVQPVLRMRVRAGAVLDDRVTVHVSHSDQHFFHSNGRRIA